MTPEERRKFLESHRLAVVGVGRDGMGPHLTPVYYVLDGDDLIASVTNSRVKTKLARKSGTVSLCVLHEQFPFPYVTVTGRARIEEEGAVDVMMRVGEKMTGNPVPESMRPALAERARNEQRVVLRVTPEKYTSRD